MANILPHTDAGWLKFFQNIYTIALITTVLATVFINRFASRIATSTAIQIAKANEIAAVANERTAQLQKENLEIRRQMADRFLTPTERKTIVEGLSSYRGHHVIIQLLPESEPKDYGNSIIAALEEAGWVVQKNQALLSPSSVTPRGLVLRLGRHPDSGAKALEAVLQALEPNLKLDEADAQQDSYAELQVGTKR
jgi:hypothetical protein